jgi:hypothetical protein
MLAEGLENLVLLYGVASRRAYVFMGTKCVVPVRVVKAGLEF